MNYGQILKNAFKVTFKRRILWLFGLFAVGGGLSYINYSFGSFEDIDQVTYGIESIFSDYFCFVKLGLKPELRIQ